MTKPWNERWEVDRLHRATIVMRDRERPPFYLSRVGYFEDSRHDVPLERDEACAKLAAAAPAMARLLCRLEWSGLATTTFFDGQWFPYDEGDDGCPECGALAPADPATYVASETLDGPMRPHRPDCELDRVLTTAGISPEEREGVRAT